MKPKFNFNAATKKSTNEVDPDNKCVIDNTINSILIENPSDNINFNSSETALFTDTSILSQLPSSVNETLHNVSTLDNTICKSSQKSIYNSPEANQFNENLILLPESEAVRSNQQIISKSNITDTVLTKITEKVIVKKRFNFKNAIIKPQAQVVAPMLNVNLNNEPNIAHTEPILSSEKELQPLLEDTTSETIATLPIVTSEVIIPNIINDNVKDSLPEKNLHKKGRFNIKNALSKDNSNSPTETISDGAVSNVLLDRSDDNVRIFEEPLVNENSSLREETNMVAIETHVTQSLSGNEKDNHAEELTVKKSQPSKFNYKSALSKETVKSPIKGIAAISGSEPTKERSVPYNINTDCDDARSLSSVSTNKTLKRKEKPFVIKNMSMVPDDDSIDTSTLSLKSLINLSAKLPPPKTRMDIKKKKKDTKKIIDCASVVSETNEEPVREEGAYRIDTDGNIVVNTAANAREGIRMGSLDSMDVVVEDAACINSSYRSFMKHKLSGKRWTAAETDNFYKALFIAGTNFSAMETIFVGRTRNDLKRKFQVEEKLKPEHIAYILNNPTPYNYETIKFDSHIPPVVTKPRRDAIKRMIRGERSEAGDDDGSVRSKECVATRTKRRRLSVDTAEDDLPGLG